MKYLNKKKIVHCAGRRQSILPHIVGPPIKALPVKTATFLWFSPSTKKMHDLSIEESRNLQSEYQPEIKWFL